MRSFRFSAEAALQYRRRQHDAALARQAAAERALIDAERAVSHAGETVRGADARLADATRESLAAARLLWHLAWRARCVGEREQLDAQRRQRSLELEQARQVVNESRRRVRSLERFRENALLGWTQLVQLEDRKTMDALAASQFVRRKDE
jgi:hypothetical protein